MKMLNQESCNGESRRMVVIYPAPGAAGAGHLSPVEELARLLVSHGLAVTVVLRGIPPDNNAVYGGCGDASAASPFLSFHYVPEPPLAPRVGEGDFVANVFELTRASNPDFRDFLRVASPAALIFFCYSAAELGIPTYFLYLTCTAGLAVLLHLPVIHEQNIVECSEVVNVPGVPPIPVKDLPAAILDRSSLSYQHFLALSEQLCKSSGVMVNSCRSLEPRATDAVLSGVCTLPGRTTPPLFTIGPLIKSDEVSEKRGQECLSWLDTQAKASVLFLCFGSLGRFSAEQIGEMAVGLEISGKRFLWVVRLPPGGHQDRGLVVMSWAPQRKVLAHGSAGGFVTHCGWNSVLEAVVAGVPMLGWPLYAEQRMTRVSLVDEMKLAVAVEGREGAVVTAEEIGTKVSWLLDSDGGRELRQRTLAAMTEARNELSEGGDSRKALLKLVQEWIM